MFSLNDRFVTIKGCTYDFKILDGFCHFKSEQLDPHNFNMWPETQASSFDDIFQCNTTAPVVEILKGIADSVIF